MLQTYGNHHPILIIFRRKSSDRVFQDRNRAQSIRSITIVTATIITAWNCVKSSITIIINRFARMCTPELIRLTWPNSISEHQSGSSVAHVFRTSRWWEMRDGFRWVPCVLPSPWSPGHQGAPLPAPTNPANGRPGRCRWFQLAAGPRGALTASETWWWTILLPTTSGPSTALRDDVTRPLDAPLVGAGRARGERRQVHRGKRR